MKKRAQHDEPAWPKSIIVSSTPSLLLTVSTLDWKGGKRSIYTPHCQFDLVKLVMQIEGKDFLFHKRYFEIPLMDEIIIIIMINSPQLPSNLCMYIFLTRARTQEAGCNHKFPTTWVVRSTGVVVPHMLYFESCVQTQIFHKTTWSKTACMILCNITVGLGNSKGPLAKWRRGRGWFHPPLNTPLTLGGLKHHPHETF